jgi:choline dehydrogenase
MGSPNKYERSPQQRRFRRDRFLSASVVCPTAHGSLEGAEPGPRGPAAASPIGFAAMATHDYVVVGAGSAGCVVAARLSASGASVLLLESGGSDRHLGVRAPAAFSTLFQSTRDWNYLSEPEPALLYRRVYLPRGRMLGGSSSMNAMLYVRGNRGDYDGWVSAGAEGWGYDAVLPYFKRSEDNADFGAPFHGRDGELSVTNRRWLSPHWEPFLDAGARAGVPRIEDCNGPEQEGGALLQATIRRR